MTRERTSKSTRSIYTDAYLKHRRLLTVGWLLVTAGLIMAAFHIFTHLAGATVLGRWQDLLIGYPAAAMLVLAGSMIIMRKPKSEGAGSVK